MLKIKTAGYFILAITLSISAAIKSQPIYEQTFKFGKFIDYLDRYYVDTVNTAKFVEEAIVKTLENLDPHSVYISQEDFEKMNEPLEGNFEGIGIQFNILKDTLMVVTPIPGGPSEEVGILAGDRIIEVEGENIAGVGLTNDDVFRLLRGAKGTQVKVGILRRNMAEMLDFTITRDKIPIYSLDAAYMIDDVNGYIKINRFAATTMMEFNKAMADLLDKGMKNLVLDLTGNGGGYLNAAVEMGDEFLENESLIVYTEGLNSYRKEYRATQKGRFEQGNLVIMIDEGSASASEIVSGAAQDWDRAVIVGRRSFGKGLVQSQLMLPDNSAIRLTIARYYTPTGRLIQKPYTNGRDSYQKEIYERYLHGEFTNEDSITFPDSLKYKTLNDGRTVYGGGGITPDIFVALDTSFYSDYYGSILRKGIINRFVLTYVDNNRKDLQKKYPEFPKFESSFTADGAILKQLTDFATSEGVELNEEEFKTSEEQISVFVKARIAMGLYGTSEFYQVLNKRDNIFIKGVEVLNNWDLVHRELFERK